MSLNPQILARATSEEIYLALQALFNEIRMRAESDKVQISVFSYKADEVDISISNGGGYGAGPEVKVRGKLLWELVEEIDRRENFERRQSQLKLGAPMIEQVAEFTTSMMPSALPPVPLDDEIPF